MTVICQSKLQRFSIQQTIIIFGNTADLLLFLGTWIITGGMQAGVMRLVHDRSVADGSETGLVAIRIATSGDVKGKDCLKNHDVSIAI